MNKRKICIVLTARGNYAKLKSLIELVENDNEMELQLILGGMVVLEKYGRIGMALKDLGITPVRNINFVVEGENLATMSKSSGLAMLEFSTAFEELRPDIVVIMADRFECLPIAMCAAYMNIAVAHLEGGEVTGSIDESIRHAITKLSHIHFPSSQESALRIERMGENLESIHVVGASSFDVLRQTDLTNLESIRRYQLDYGAGPMIDLHIKKYLVVIQHPVTTEYENSMLNINVTIETVKELRMPTVWIMPNMDAGADGINKAIRKFRESNQSLNVHFFKSLPIECYGPLLKNAACLIGNSSSGIREAAFLGTPTVNIGTRQNGRQRGKNVVDVAYDKNKIIAAVRQQLLVKNLRPDYLYGDGYSAEKILKILKSTKINVQKKINY